MDVRRCGTATVVMLVQRSSPWSHSNMNVATAGLGFVCFLIASIFLFYSSSIVSLQKSFTSASSGYFSIAAPDTGVSSTTHRQGYVVALRYSGQQATGAGTLVALQRWVRDVCLPVTVVEPFVQNSVFGTYRSSLPAVRFSDLFDLELFNRVSLGEGLPELTPWETFLAAAPRHAILVKMIRVEKHAPLPPPSVVWTQSPGRRNECWAGQGEGGSDGGNGSNTNSYAAVLQERLCYVRVVASHYQLTSSRSLQAAEVCTSVLGGMDPTSLTIAFQLWRAPWHTTPPIPPPPLAPHSLRPTSALNIPSSCSCHSREKGTGDGGPVPSRLQPSSRLLQHVQQYKQQFLHSFPGSSYVAVLLRGERAVRLLRYSKSRKSHPNMPVLLRECLQRVVSNTTALVGPRRTRDVFVMADIGQYGSGSWETTIPSNQSERGVVEGMLRSAVEELYGRRWTFEQWEKSFSRVTGNLTDAGYIAALQRTVASRASCLVVLGGGSFHELVIRSYLERTAPHKRCIRVFCLAKKFSWLATLGESITGH